MKSDVEDDKDSKYKFLWKKLPILSAASTIFGGFSTLIMNSIGINQKLCSGLGIHCTAGSVGSSKFVVESGLGGHGAGDPRCYTKFPIYCITSDSSEKKLKPTTLRLKVDSSGGVLHECDLVPNNRNPIPSYNVGCFSLRDEPNKSEFSEKRVCAYVFARQSDCVNRVFIQGNLIVDQEYRQKSNSTTLIYAACAAVIAVFAALLFLARRPQSYK